MTPSGPNAQIIVHWPIDPTGRFRCDQWGPMPFSHPAMISIVPTSPGGPALQSAQQLARALGRTLLSIGPGAQPSVCGGPGPRGCRGHGQQGSPCVLVLVGDGAPISDYSGAVALWDSRIGIDGRYRVVPVCSPRSRAAMVAALPAGIRNRNVMEWVRSPAETVPSVLSAADLFSNDYRVFISYRQEDGQQYADDLFAALTYSGFDVFLDRVRIGIGASIPDRIREELAHKSVLIVIETPLVGNSAWVGREVAFAAASRLGILAIHFPSGTRIPSVSNRRRYQVQSTDFDPNRNLTPAAVANICSRVSDLHDRWLIRRRYQLQRSLSNTLLFRGIINQQLNQNGCLNVVPKWNQRTICSIRTTPRPADLDDFRELDNSAARPSSWQRAVIAPGSLIAGERQARMRWLSGNVRTSLFDESEVRHVADILADPGATELI
jgi:hypothetical protein